MSLTGMDALNFAREHGLAALYLWPSEAEEAEGLVALEEAGRFEPDSLCVTSSLIDSWIYESPTLDVLVERLIAADPHFSVADARLPHWGPLPQSAQLAQRAYDSEEPEPQWVGLVYSWDASRTLHLRDFRWVLEPRAQ